MQNINYRLNDLFIVNKITVKRSFQIINYRLFFLRLSHIGKKYYYGRLVRWLIADKHGVSVYCAKCGNIANGINTGRVLGFSYTIPLCKKHLQ